MQSDAFPILECLHPELEPYVELAISLPPPSESSVDEVRAGYAMSQPPAPHIKVGHVEEYDIGGPGGSLRVRQYTPEGEGPHPVIAHYHGGGFSAGDLDTHDGQCRYLCNHSQCIVVAVDYRLTPEHPWPAAHLDAYAALEWLHENAANIGGAPNRLGVAGDSAGGNLSASCAIHALKTGGPKLRGQLIVVPATGGRFPRELMAERDNPVFSMDLLDWASGNASDESLANLDYTEFPLPIDLLAEESEALAEVAPAIVAVAEIDILFEHGVAYAEMLKRCGAPSELVLAEGMVHGFFSMPHMFRSAETYCISLAEKMKVLMYAD